MSVLLYGCKDYTLLKNNRNQCYKQWRRSYGDELPKLVVQKEKQTNLFIVLIEKRKTKFFAK